MPIYVHLSNFIVDKKAIERSFNGGVEAFRERFMINSEPYNQEDNQLFSISRMNVDAFDIRRFTNGGLFFDEEKQYSNDFTICQRYVGIMWQVDWLIENKVFAWHIDCDANEKKEVERISTMSMDEIIELQNKGNNLLTTIKF